MIPSFFPLVLWAMLCVFQLGKAQIDYIPGTNKLSCSKIGGNYCYQGSLRDSIMLSCVSETVIEIRACDIQLSKILPKGYNNIATCYESSMDSGDALCAFNGTGYTLDGTHVKVPETTICHDIIPPDEYEDEVSRYSTTTAAQVLTRSALTNFPLPATEHQTAIRVEAGITVCSNPWPACTTCAPTQETRITPTTSTTTITNLPTDSSGRPYSVVTEIMSVGTKSGQDQETSLKGVVLVEPSSPVTGPGDGGASVGTVVVAFDRLRLLGWFGFWFLVGWVRVLL